jgi:hypothetical protein
MKDAELQKTIIKRLNTLISLTSDIASSKDSTPTSQKIHHLFDLGLSPAEIGEIINKPTNYITATIHQKKKRSKK